MNKKIIVHFKKQITNSTLTIFLICLFTVLNSFSANFHSESYKAKKLVILKVDQMLTLQYSNASFKAGSIGVSEAIVSIPDGIFTCRRISSTGHGNLCMNRSTGAIDHENSQAGEYMITYTVNNQFVTQKIIVTAN
jgi:hypothetical protein